MSITLTEVAIPSTGAGRPKLDNPMLALVKSRLDKRDKAAQFVVPVTDALPADKHEAQIKRQLSAAARECDVAVRRVVKHDEMAKTLTVTFWLKDKPAKKDEKADPVKASK